MSEKPGPEVQNRKLAPIASWQGLRTKGNKKISKFAAAAAPKKVFKTASNEGGTARRPIQASGEERRDSRGYSQQASRYGLVNSQFDWRSRWCGGEAKGDEAASTCSKEGKVSWLATSEGSCQETTRAQTAAEEEEEVVLSWCLVGCCSEATSVLETILLKATMFNQGAALPSE